MAASKKTTLKRVPPIGRIIQPLKGNMRNFEALNGLDKRIKGLAEITVQNAIDAALAQPGLFQESLDIGYFTNGGSVAVKDNQVNFKSPADNYQYIQDEVLYYIWNIISTRTAGVGFTQGQRNFPGIAAANSGAGQLYWMLFNIDLSTLLVITSVSYFDGAEHITTDGLIRVTAICKRKS